MLVALRCPLTLPCVFCSGAFQVPALAESSSPSFRRTRPTPLPLHPTQSNPSQYLSTHPPTLCTTNTVCFPPLLRGLAYYRASKARSHRCFWCNTRILYIRRLYARKPRAKATGNVTCGTRRIGRFRVPRPSWTTTQQHATPVPRARH